jgi:hypothetical protein
MGIAGWPSACLGLVGQVNGFPTPSQKKFFLGLCTVGLGRSLEALVLGWGSFRKHQEAPGPASLFWDWNGCPGKEVGVAGTSPGVLPAPHRPGGGGGGCRGSHTLMGGAQTGTRQWGVLSL